MSPAKIEAAKQREALPYEVAKQIRELLDQARAQYGKTDWDDEAVEDKIQQLVFED